jgi:hypothetical protein
MSSPYLPPPEYLEYIVDPRPPRRRRRPRLRRWIVLG